MGCPAPLCLKCWVLPIRHPGRLSNCRLRREVLLTGGQSKSFLFTSYKRWVALTDDAYVSCPVLYLYDPMVLWYLILWVFKFSYENCHWFDSSHDMKPSPLSSALPSRNGITALFFYLLKNSSPVSCVCRLGCCTTHLKPACTVNYTLI